MAKELLKATRVVPCSVVLLSVGTKAKQDAMTAAAIFVSEDPPLCVVSVAKHIVSHDLIEAAAEFVLNVASTDQVELAKKLGSTHGRNVDKFRKFNIKTKKATRIKSPMIEDSYANIECRVITTMTAASYTVYLAQVVACKINEKLKPVAWFNNKYFAMDKALLT
jgi:flavin reductase (DIM6/NTAB) family NADH-FMN oxidoreductase RutF